MNGLGKKALVFESKPLYESQLSGVVQQYVKSKNFTISPTASVLLVESVGNSVTTLVRELEKLFIALPSGEKHISESLVEHNIGISREYSIFELQNMISAGNTAQTLKIAHYLAARQTDRVVYMIERLFDLFSKLIKYHISTNKGNEYNLATELGVNKYFVRNYETGAKRFSLGKIVAVVSLLREYDLKCKGVGVSSSDDKGEIFKELVAKIMYL
jgi:DNA polymerase-3 subunit delta